MEKFLKPSEFADSPEKISRNFYKLLIPFLPFLLSGNLSAQTISPKTEQNQKLLEYSLDVLRSVPLETKQDSIILNEREKTLMKTVVTLLDNRQYIEYLLQIGDTANAFDSEGIAIGDSIFLRNHIVLPPDELIFDQNAGQNFLSKEDYLLLKQKIFLVHELSHIANSFGNNYLEYEKNIADTDSVPDFLPDKISGFNKNYLNMPDERVAFFTSLKVLFDDYQERFKISKESVLNSEKEYQDFKSFYGLYFKSVFDFIEITVPEEEEQRKLLVTSLKRPR